MPRGEKMARCVWEDGNRRAEDGVHESKMVTAAGAGATEARVTAWGAFGATDEGAFVTAMRTSEAAAAMPLEAERGVSG
jgi:hypothetical protein